MSQNYYTTWINENWAVYKLFQNRNLINLNVSLFISSTWYSEYNLERTVAFAFMFSFCIFIVSKTLISEAGQFHVVSSRTNQVAECPSGYCLKKEKIHLVMLDQCFTFLRVHFLNLLHYSITTAVTNQREKNIGINFRVGGQCHVYDQSLSKYPNLAQVAALCIRRGRRQVRRRLVTDSRRLTWIYRNLALRTPITGRFSAGFVYQRLDER